MFFLVTLLSRGGPKSKILANTPRLRLCIVQWPHFFSFEVFLFRCPLGDIGAYLTASPSSIVTSAMLLLSLTIRCFRRGPSISIWIVAWSINITLSTRPPYHNFSPCCNLQTSSQSDILSTTPSYSANIQCMTHLDFKGCTSLFVHYIAHIFYIALCDTVTRR